MSESKPAVVDPVEPGRAVVAYLYHDAQTPEDAHPWLHSSLLVLAADRRRTLRHETPLVTLAQAEAMVAAERERWEPTLRSLLAAKWCTPEYEKASRAAGALRGPRRAARLTNDPERGGLSRSGSTACSASGAEAKGKTVTEYHKSVWCRAMQDAESDVMRVTATLIGGRLQGEDLIAYVARAKQVQGAAIARWMTAKAELEALEAGSAKPPESDCAYASRAEELCAASAIDMRNPWLSEGDHGHLAKNTGISCSRDALRELLTKAREVAEWHVSEGDERGTLARSVMDEIDRVLRSNAQAQEQR